MMTLLERWRHRRWRTLLSAYVDRQLGEGQRRRLEAHLQACDACRSELEELRTTVALLRRMPQPTLPRSFLLAREPELAPQARSLGLRWATQAAATMAVVALALVVLADATGALPSDAGGLALTAKRQAGAEDLVAPESSATLERSLAEEAASPEGTETGDSTVTPPLTDETGAAGASAAAETPSSQYPAYLEMTLLALALLLGAVALTLRLRSHRLTI